MTDHNPNVEVLPPEGDKGRGLPPESERNWAMLCHLSAFVGYVIPFGHLLGPLLLWLLKGESLPLVNDQGKEALNFQLSMTIYYIVAGVLIFAIIGIPILVVLVLFHLIMIIVASVRAKGGERYRYPLTIRLIR
jgi:uncharacterized protein